MDFFKITKSTIEWFEPIIAPEAGLRLETEPNVFAIGAVMDKAACGVLIFELENDKAEIIYIAVSNTARRKGVGTGLLNYLCEHAKETDTMVGCSFTARGKTDPLYLFFASQEGFTTTQDDGFVCEVSMKQLKNSVAIKEKAPEDMIGFFDLDGVSQKSFFAEMREAGNYVIGNREGFIKPLCVCVTEAHKVTAAVFFEMYGESELALCFAYCKSGCGAKLAGLLGESARRIVSKLPENTVISVAAVTPQSAAIVRKLLPEYTETECFFRSDWDMGE